MFKRIAKLPGLKPKTIATTAAGKERLADKLESLLETTADAVVGVASNGHIAFVNPQTVDEDFTEKQMFFLQRMLLGFSYYR